MSQTVRTLLMVSLVVLAGCSGLPGDDGGDGGGDGLADGSPGAGTDHGDGDIFGSGTGTPSDRSAGPAAETGTAPPSPTGTAAPTAPVATPTLTSTPTATPEELPLVAQQAWWTESGINLSQLFREHVDALNESGSYTSRSTRSFQPFNDSRYVFEGEFSAAASRSQGRLIWNWSGPGIVSAGPDGEYLRYTEADEPIWYSRVDNGSGAASYRTDGARSEEFAVRYLQGVSYFDTSPPIGSFRFEPAGVVERGGDQLYRFTADSHVASDSPGGVVSGTDVTDVNATLLVRRDGLIKRFAFEYVSTQHNYGEADTDVRGRAAGVYELTDVGSTTVERPDWLDEASAASDE